MLRNHRIIFGNLLRLPGSSFSIPKRWNSSQQESKAPQPVSPSSPPSHFQNPQNPPSYFQSEKPPTAFVSKTAKPSMNSFEKVVPLGAPVATAPKEPISFVRKLFYVSPLIAIIVGCMGLFSSIENEQITPEVANALELAVKSENNEDIDDAIGCYLEALQLMDEDGTEHISPMYVSTALRIAQLYEYIKKLDKALAIYKELSDIFIYALAHRSEYDSLFTENLYNKAIRTSLAISIRFAQLLPPERFQEGKDALLFNITRAQGRIIDIYPPFLPVINDINNRNILYLLTSELEKEFESLTEEQKAQRLEESTKNPIELPLYATDETEETQLLGLHIGGWPVFTKNLIIAKDTLANLSIESGDLSEGISNLVSNTNFIQRSFEHPAIIALTFSKLAIALQMTYQVISKDYPKESVIEIIQNDKPMSVDISSPEIKDFVLNTTMVESERIFRKVLDLCDKSKKVNGDISPDPVVNKVKRQLDHMFKPAFDKSEMVAAVGLGLIEYQRGQYPNSLLHFNRAKLLAVKLRDKDYIQDVTGWIDDVERKM